MASPRTSLPVPIVFLATPRPIHQYPSLFSIVCKKAPLNDGVHVDGAAGSVPLHARAPRRRRQPVRRSEDQARDVPRVLGHPRQGCTHSRGWHFSRSLSFHVLSSFHVTLHSKHQLMTASIFHVTNLTPGSDNSYSKAGGSLSPPCPCSSSTAWRGSRRCSGETTRRWRCGSSASCAKPPRITKSSNSRVTRTTKAASSTPACGGAPVQAKYS